MFWKWHFYKGVDKQNKVFFALSSEDWERKNSLLDC